MDAILSALPAWLLAVVVAGLFALGFCVACGGGRISISRGPLRLHVHWYGLKPAGPARHHQEAPEDKARGATRSAP